MLLTFGEQKPTSKRHQTWCQPGGEQSIETPGHPRVVNLIFVNQSVVNLTWRNQTLVNLTGVYLTFVVVYLSPYDETSG